MVISSHEKCTLCLKFSLSSTSQFDRVVVSSDCNNNDIAISSIRGTETCRLLNVPLFPTTGMEYSLHVNSKDSNIHYVNVKADVFNRGSYVGTGTTVVTVYPLNLTTSNPVISGVSGPQTLNVNQVGTWTVTASNRDGGNLSYSVKWGDVVSAGPTTNSSQQTATFTHSYTNPGNYRPTFTVTNASGQTAQTSLSVNVGGVITQSPTIISILPAGCITNTGFSSVTGEPCSNSRASANFGDKVYVYGSGFSSNASAYIATYSNTTGMQVKMPTTFYSSSIISFVVSADAGSGNHGLTYYPFYPGSLQSNTVSLNFVGSTTPSITVLSPNGGEVVTIGDFLKYKSTFYSTKIGNVCNYITTSKEINTSNKMVNCANGYNPSVNSTDSGSIQLTNNYISPGTYYWLSVWQNTDGTGWTYDFSDAPFSIVGGTTNVLTITTPSVLPNAKVGSFYNTSILATGGNSNYTYNWSLPTSGGGSSLPNGMSLSQTPTPCLVGAVCLPKGIISGIPTIAGTYSFYIQISSGYPVYNAVQQQFTLTVDPATSTPSITVLSPNGGETFTQGGILAGAFTTSNIASGTSCDVSIVGRKSDGSPVDGTIANVITDGTGREFFRGNIPANLVPVGSYKIRVACGSNILAQDQSDATFSIVAPTTTSCSATSINGYSVPAKNNGESIAIKISNPVANGTRFASTTFTCNNGTFTAGPEIANIVCDTGYTSIGTQCVATSATTPSITLLSPNGGEKLVKGSVYRIKWNSVGLKNNVTLGYSFGVGSMNWIANNIPNTGYYDWTVNIGNTANTQVKIYVLGYKDSNIGGTVDDYSDNNVTISTPSLPIIPPYTTNDLGASVISALDSVPASPASTPSTTSNITPNTSAYKFTKFLDEGTSGAEVLALQKYLNKAGYDVGTIDGFYGPKVKEAVTKFQTANKLKADGIVGFEVRMVLNK